MRSARTKKISTSAKKRGAAVGVAGVFLIAVYLFAIPAAVADTSNGRIGLLRPIFNSGIEKITTAVNVFRNLLGGGIFSKEKKSQELEARRSVLVSVIELLIQETEQSRTQLAQLSVLAADEKKRMTQELEENTLWFTSLLDAAHRVQSAVMVQLLATDIQQFKDHRHNVLIRAIAEFSIAEKQKKLLGLASVRASRMASDIAALNSKAYNLDALSAFLRRAENDIDRARELLGEALELLVSIAPPYERKYDPTIEQAHELLIEVGATLNDAYQAFVEMTRLVQEF